MSRLVLLLEEYSMKVLLDGLLPRLFPTLSFLCVSFEGKHDLEKEIPRKLRSWREPGARFVVIRDNDCGDCQALKRRLAGLCEEGGHPEALVRIVCQELEAWYLAEPDALAEAFDAEHLRSLGCGKRYRSPDSVQRPSAEMKKLVPGFHKSTGARLMASRLSRERNRSRSFQTLIAGIERVAASIPEEAPFPTPDPKGDED